jgi:hypothetical protein
LTVSWDGTPPARSRGCLGRKNHATPERVFPNYSSWLVTIALSDS